MEIEMEEVLEDEWEGKWREGGRIWKKLMGVWGSEATTTKYFAISAFAVEQSNHKNKLRGAKTCNVENLPDESSRHIRFGGQIFIEQDVGAKSTCVFS